MVSLTITVGRTPPADIEFRSGKDTKYASVYKGVIEMQFGTWAEIGGLPNKLSTSRLQACLNPSAGGEKRAHHPRAYLKALLAQNARLETHRYEHKDGTYSLWVKKVKRSAANN